MIVLTMSEFALLLVERYSKRLSARMANWSRRRQVPSRASHICERGIRVSPPSSSLFGRSLSDALKRLPPLDEGLAPPRIELLFEDSADPTVAPDSGLAALTRIGVCTEGALPHVMTVAGPLAGAAEGEYVAQIKVELASQEAALHHRPKLMAAAQTVDLALKGARYVKLPVPGELAAMTREYLAAIGHGSVLEVAHDVGACHSSQHLHMAVSTSTVLTAAREVRRLARGKTTPQTAARHVLVHGVAVTVLTWAGKLLAGFIASLVASPAAVLAAEPVGGFLGGLLGRIVSRVCDAAPFERAAEEFYNFASQAAEWESKALNAVNQKLDAQKTERQRSCSADMERLMKAARSSCRRADLKSVQEFVGSFAEIVTKLRGTQRANEARILHVLERKTLEWWLCRSRRLAARAARENFHRAERQLTGALERFVSCYSQGEQLQFALSWLRENRPCSKEMVSAVDKFGANVQKTRDEISTSLQGALDRCVQRHRRRFKKDSAPVLAKWTDNVAEWSKRLHGIGASMLRKAEEIGRAVTLGGAAQTRV